MNNVYPYKNGLAWAVFRECYLAGLWYWDATNPEAAYTDPAIAWEKFLTLPADTPTPHGFRSSHAFYHVKLVVPAANPSLEVQQPPSGAVFAEILARACARLATENPHEPSQTPAGPAGP